MFPSEEGGPLFPGNIRRRHLQSPLKAQRLTRIRPHDSRRTFIALHVEAVMHPKLVQEGVGHSNIKLTMNVYGKPSGKIALVAEQVARLDTIASVASLSLATLGQQATRKQARITNIGPKNERP